DPFRAGQSLRSSGSDAASTISPSVSIDPLSRARSAPAAVPCRFFADLGYRNRQTGGQFSEAEDMRLRLGARSFGLILGLIAAVPGWAADPAPDQFKSEVESFLGKLDGITSGLLIWEGSDSFDFRQEG